MRHSTGEEARATILAATRRCFVALGVRGASIADIAAEAGCSKASVLYHFGSRDEMVRALLAPLWSDIESLADRLTAMEDATAARELAVAEMVEIGVRHRADLSVFFGELPHIINALQFAKVRAAHDTIRAALVGRINHPIADIVSVAVLSGHAAACHEFHDAPDDVLRAALWHTTNSVCVTPIEGLTTRN